MSQPTSNSETAKTDPELCVQYFLLSSLSNLWGIYNGPINYKLARGIDLEMSEINALDSSLTLFFSYLTGSEPTSDQLAAIRTQVINNATAIVKSGIIPAS